MDSFFGIGPLELLFILIFALIFLGPERLPAAVRQVMNVIRQIRDLSSTLSQQLGDEFGDMRDLDPRYQFQQMLDEPSEKEKEAAKKAEEKKKADEKKKANAKKAEDKRKADEKKKTDEAKKKAEEAAKLAVAEAAEKKADDSTVASTPVVAEVAPAVGEEKAPLTASQTDGETAAGVVAGASVAKQPKQPKQRSADDQTSPASAPFVEEQTAVEQRTEARTAANSLIPKASENSIAPPMPRAEAPVNGTHDDSSASTVTPAVTSAVTSTETVESPVVEEEEA